MQKKAKHKARVYFMAIIIFNVYYALFGDQRATLLFGVFYVTISFFASDVKVRWFGRGLELVLFENVKMIEKHT